MAEKITYMGVIIVFTLFILSMIFIMFGHIYRDDVQLVLKNELIKFPESSIDWWSVSHFMLYAIIGYIIPGHPLTFFTIGLSFELFEDYLSSNQNTQLCDCNDQAKNQLGAGSFWCQGYEDGYWYMNPTDPMINLLGYVVGSSIA